MTGVIVFRNGYLPNLILLLAKNLAETESDARNAFPTVIYGLNPAAVDVREIKSSKPNAKLQIPGSEPRNPNITPIARAIE